jgi:hypothetical protein
VTPAEALLAIVASLVALEEQLALVAHLVGGRLFPSISCSSRPS